MYFLRKLKSFQVDNTILQLFYSSALQSIFTFCLICWGGNTKICDKDKIEKIIKRASRISNFTFEDFNSIYSRLCNKKVLAILKDESHPLNKQIIFSERSGRPLSIRSNRERYTSSFLPSAVRLLQSNFKRWNFYIYNIWNFYVLLLVLFLWQKIMYIHITFLYLNHILCKFLITMCNVCECFWCTRKSSQLCQNGRIKIILLLLWHMSGPLLFQFWFIWSISAL